MKLNKKYISIGICILVYIIVIFLSGWWLAKNQCFYLNMSNVKEINGTTIYSVNVGGIPQQVEPPCSFYIWKYVWKYIIQLRDIIGILAGCYIIYFMFKMREYLDKYLILK